MVSPILSIAVALGAGFLIPLVAQLKPKAREGSILAAALFYAAVAVLIAIPASWLPQLAAGADDVLVFTAGARPPLSINLQLGLAEGLLLVLVNLAGLLGALAMQRTLWNRGATGYVLYLMMVLGANGLILTRDLFNVFVFLEIMSIGTYGIIASDDTPEQYAAGFKYIIAGGISSILFLLGTVYLYRLTGTLSIDGMIAAGPLAGAAGFTAAFLLFAGLLIELKPVPANGWALDVYQAANPGVAGFVSAGNATAVVFVLYKVLPLFPEGVLRGLTRVGVITFLAANLIGLKQTSDRRMLGYSSVAQIGLVSAALAIIQLDGLSGTYLFIVAGGLLVNHLLAKAGLFWIAGGAAYGGADGAGGGAARFPGAGPAASGRVTVRRGIGPVAGIGAVVLGLALVGLPPFPGFWAKWQLVNTLVASDRIALLVLILLGSLFEAIYILRWAGKLIARPEEQEAVDAAAGGRVALGAGAGIGVVILVLLIGAVGVFTGWYLGLNDRLIAAIFGFAVGMLLLEWLPSRVKGIIAIVAIGGYAWLAYPRVSGLALIFGAIFAAGGILAVIASLHRRTPFGTYALYVLTATGLTGLVVANEPVTFFVVWELMTIGSYLLIARSARHGARGEGGRAPQAATRYIAFSIGGALLIMVGLVLALQGSLASAAGAVSGGGVALPELFGADGYVVMPALTGGWPAGADVSGAAAAGAGAAQGAAGAAGLGAWAAGIPESVRVAVFVLLGLGFLVKMGAIALHVWVPDSYAEADDDVTAFLSSSLSKAGLFGVILLLVLVGAPAIGAGAGAGAVAGGTGLNVFLGWVGALTALFGALLAVFQEDVKRLLAYSSLSQVGYMVLAISLATHLGWVAGIYLAVIHFIFKGLLFIGMTGVIHRSGTRYMYEMGGLIKRMPLTFIAVLMSIIALSGVPPLAGFGGKWLIYGALMESGWWVQTGVAFFASTIAFLYLYRMIQTVFLGQLKDNLREVKEAPAPILIPLILLMGALMVSSMYPNLVLRPIMEAIEPFLASTARWQDYTVITALGYWNGNLVMYVTMGVFALPLIWLIAVMRRPQKVRQFNIVYAAERPERPETTHFAHNFFAPYRKALGFMTAPAVTRAWQYVSDGVLAIGGTLRQLYTGNAQTYALHILLMTVVLYLVTGGI